MNTELGDDGQDESEAARFAALPPDFPRPANLGAVSGAQAKFLMTRYQGRFYSPGCTPPELLERWNNCEDLAQQLAVKSIESKTGKRAHMTETEILDQYLPRLIATGWVSEPEAKWVMRRTAELVGWQAPPSAFP
ncbi:hypothetical protein [Duganella sp. LjRoot269]|uniref:hypothetical protein n=1 Tax=Duganella sp. LjRoot269 TaxID=3342305 RepID=UPI003ED0F00D